jgi:hypothetical protein
VKELAWRVSKTGMTTNGLEARREIIRSALYVAFGSAPIDASTPVFGKFATTIFRRAQMQVAALRLNFAQRIGEGFRALIVAKISIVFPEFTSRKLSVAPRR